MKGFRRRLRIEGVMPERALLKIKRAGIALYNVKKINKTQLECSVSVQDAKRVLALHSGYSSFTVTDLGAEGNARRWEWLQRRLGILLGVCLFCAGSLQAERFVFAVDLAGTTAYAREVYMALEANGIRPFHIYPVGRERAVCATLLALPGVEFCTVQKTGMRVRVEMHLYDLPPQSLQRGDLCASRSGKVLSITVLKGTAATRVGEQVHIGEPLVHGWFFVEGKGQVSVEPIARVSMACVYEGVVDAETEEQAFAIGYLALGLNEGDCVVKREVTQTDEGFFVRIEYTVIESINL